jgi:CxxC motif-containing protein (DUF1111 family)
MRHAGLAAVLVGLAAPALAAGVLDRAIGEKLFHRQWIAGPASTKADDGLGPLFSASSCAACHPKGRGSDAPVVRFGDGAEGDPVYGRQLQPLAVLGIVGEGRLVIASNGKPTIADLAYGPLTPRTRIGLRRPPDLAGLGAAERLGDDAILVNVGGEAGGVAHRLPDGRIGRYGWKATGASLSDQISAAFSADMGMSTTRHRDAFGDCTEAQAACRTAPTGEHDGKPEIAEPIIAAITAYVGALVAPPPKGDGPGAVLFQRFGCAACHRPTLADAKGNKATLYSDLLLHEMGPALDDGIAEPGVASSQWRTAPLLGLGSRLAAGYGLLHDGRAATIDHAVADHAGDAATARQAYQSAPEAERDALLAFLTGL